MVDVILQKMSASVKCRIDFIRTLSYAIYASCLRRVVVVVLFAKSGTSSPIVQLSRFEVQLSLENDSSNHRRVQAQTQKSL